ncbi:MAG TPA: polysaccharide deacetylase family protein [Gammaproteobacteria bacterium]
MDRLFALRSNTRNVPLIICYHRVVADFQASTAYSIAPMLTGERTFELHLDWIGRRFQFVTLDEMAAWMEGRKTFNRPIVAITFDDGYVDVYRHAFPILRRKGIPAAVFVVTDRTGTADLQTYDELYLLLRAAFLNWPEPNRRFVELLLGLEIPPSVLKKIETAAVNPVQATWALIENMPQTGMKKVLEALRTQAEIPAGARAELCAMNWEMLREVAQSDITIGSHTRTHPFMILENWERMVDEIRGSREDLQRRLGTPVEHFAYPSGAFDSAVVSAVAAAGYRYAYTSCRHRDSRYPALTMPRYLLWEKSCMSAFGRFSPALMSCQVNGVFDMVKSCQQGHSF